jgi:hypothetical protein
MVYPFLVVFLRCHDRVKPKSLDSTGRLRDLLEASKGEITLDEGSIKACAFLSKCVEFDNDSEATNGLTFLADDLLISMRRWICDTSAVHMINFDGDITELPLAEEVKKNTVAMELFLTEVLCYLSQ